MSNLYLDSSAITKLVIDEAETAALQERIHGHNLFSSRVCVVEVTKAVARANPSADPQPFLARLGLVELDAELARVAAATGDPKLRALDAIHLASAQRLGHEVDAFVTYDERQAAAARSAGLAVETPATDDHIDS